MSLVRGKTHVVIPDTQVKPGVPTKHLEWIGRYVVEQFHDRPDVEIIHLGDHADMPSLSSYDRGKKEMEGRRYQQDIQAANEGFDLLNEPIERYNARRKACKERQWWPGRHILLGNHEDRITRAISEDARLEGAIGLDDLNYAEHGWTIHPFLEPVMKDGVGYSHYWYNPLSGRPYSGMIETRLKTIGHSFTMGHQQTLMYGVRYVGNRSQHGLVAGACLTPDHKVLTADLRYVPLGDLDVGDELVSFDEEISGRRSRRYKTGTVQALKYEEAPVVRVTMDDGKVFTVTEDHLWLTRVGGPRVAREGSSYMWRSTKQLRCGTRMVKPLEEWSSDHSHDTGYLSGIFDGEGCYGLGQLTLSQKPGPVLEKTIALLDQKYGIETATDSRQRDDVRCLRIKGGMPSIVKALGSLRPVRLLSKFRPEHLGRLQAIHRVSPTVVSIEPAGVQTIVRIDVDAKTMIVEGFGHHNCYLHDEDYKGPQGNAHWRGIIVCHEVENGSYDLMLISLDYLCRRFERMQLVDYMRTAA